MKANLIQATLVEPKEKKVKIDLTAEDGAKMSVKLNKAELFNHIKELVNLARFVKE